MNRDLTIQLYQAINEASDTERSTQWHASSIAKCPRSLYLERLGVPGLPLNEPGGGKKLRWRSGHAIEASIRPELEKIFPKLLTNIRFTNEELDLTGEFDGYDPETKTLISVKSVHDFAMVTRDGETGLKEAGNKNAMGKTTYGLKNSPYLHHEWQEHAYVLLMRHDKTTVTSDRLPEPDYPITLSSWPIEQITYVYITLGGLIACYTTPVNDDILKRVERKVAYLNLMWSKKELPTCLCHEGQEMYKVQDQYCPYKEEDGCCSEQLILAPVSSWGGEPSPPGQT